MIPLLLVVLASCAEERAPINRVQPNVVRKADLDGEWYFQQTVIDVDTSANYTTVGDNAFWSMERIRWDIQENYLYARRSFEWVENSDNTTFDLTSAHDRYAGPVPHEDGQPYMGAVVAAFRIESHFDIQREYNPTTGEEINVVVENTRDRPWFEREFIRVDWAENLATDYDFDYFYYGGGELRVDPIAYYVQENGPDEYRPVFEYQEDDLYYFDFVTQSAVRPGMTYYEYWDDEIPTCWFFVDQAVDCATTVLTIRNSFLQVDDEGEDFEPLEYKGRITEVFGFWTTDRMRVDHREGLREYQRRRYAQIHNIWEQSHTDETCQSNEDCTTEGSRCDDNVGLQIGLCEVPWDEGHFDEDCETDGDCTLPGSTCDERDSGSSQCTIPDVSQYTSRACDMDDECPGDTRCLVAGRCTIPFADRTPKPIIFYTTGGWPEDLQEVFGIVESEWDFAFRRAVAAAQGHNDPGSVDQMFYFCNSPVRPGDPAVCGETGLTVRPGDLRYNQMYYTREWNPLSPLGQSPTAPDPFTGRIFGTQITLYDSHDSLARRVLETCQLMNGQLDPTDYINGVNLENWISNNSTHWQESRGISDGSAAYGRDLSEEDVALMYRARDNDWMRMLAPSGSQRRAPEGAGHDVLRDGFERLRATGAYDPDRRAHDGFLHSLHGTPIEELMMNDEVLMMSNFAPGQPLTEDVLDEASMLSPNYSITREMRRRWTEAHNFGRNIMYVDLTNLAYEALSRRVAEMEEEEAFSYVRQQIYLSTVIHELGHGMGMFHNFTGSEDTVNFPEEWWATRTDNFTRDPGPRIVDPVTDSEIEGGLAELGYSSVMDYSANYAMGLTLGRYDLAAVLFAYGKSIEVYREVEGLTLNELDEYWASRGSSLIFWSTRPESFHYTEMYRRMGQNLFAEDNREIVTVDGLQQDLMSWVDPEDPESEPRVRVPYLFCSDYGADLGENCHRWDFGYDVYDRMQYYLNQDDFWYLQSNFRRGAIASDEERFASRVYERYYDRFKQMHDYYNLIESFFYMSYDDEEMIEEFMTDLDSGTGWGIYTVAIHDAFNHLLRTMAQPHVAWYDQITRPDGTRIWYDTGWSGGDLLELPMMEGRYYTTTWWVPGDTDDEYDCGVNFWECLHHYGFYMNKLMALQVLSEGQTFFVARDTSEDIRLWAISYFDDYAQPMMDFVGSILSEDYTAYAPYLVPEDPDDPDRGPHIVRRDYLVPELDPNLGDLPHGSQIVDPFTGFTLQLYAAVLGFGRMNSNFDNRFITSARLWVRGGDHGAIPSGDVIEYEDPETGLVYQAVVPEEGQGISQRMIEHAHRLLARSDYCNRDDPEAFDYCEAGISRQDRAVATRELLLYRDQLDFMVHLTAAYDNWTVDRYGDPSF